MPFFQLLRHILLVTITAAGLPAAVITGTVIDATTSTPSVPVKIPLDAADILTYRNLPNGTPNPFQIVPELPGFFTKQVNPYVDYELYVAVAGYHPQTLLVRNMNGSSFQIDPALVRSSHLASITFAGDPSEFYDDQVLAGTLSLSGSFPKAATVVDLGLLLGATDRVELRDEAGEPLDAGRIEIPAGATSVGFQLAGKPSPEGHEDTRIQLRAIAPTIPEAGRQVDGPQLTLKDAQRSVTLDFGGLEGVVHRYDLEDQSVIDSIATSAGEASFKGLAAGEAALFSLTPGAAAD